MSIIHVAKASGSRTEYTETHLKSVWEQGLLKPTDLYWTEGMAEWKPLSEYFAQQPLMRMPEAESGAGAEETEDDFPTPELRPAPGTYRYVNNPDPLTGSLLLLLRLSLITHIFVLWREFEIIGSATAPLLPGSAETGGVPPPSGGQSFMLTGHLAVSVVAFITLMRWIYRAVKNGRGFGAQSTRFSPGWSVGWFFVPFMNLVRPYQVMREIWQVSGDPRSWWTQPVGGVVKGWWILTLAGAFIGQAAFHLSLDAKTPEDFQTIHILSAISSAMGMLGAYVTMNLVRAIAYRQHRLVNPE